MSERLVPSGVTSLDRVVLGLRLGDNVVWQVDELADYATFARVFAEQAIRDQEPCVYIRFAPHEPILQPTPGLTIVEVDPRPGFDAFSSDIHRIIDEAGRGVRHIFDNLSALAVEWTTDEQIANFFQFACPYLFELDTVAYFALSRHQHDGKAIARIRDTTQVLFDLFRVGENLYVHPLKVAERYTQQMFLPHLIDAGALMPVSHSGDAAVIAASARRRPLSSQRSSIAPWESVYERLLEYQGNEDSPEVAPLKQEFCRMLLGNQPRINELADTYLSLDDLFGIRERLIGSGKIGGKAAGLILARCILRERCDGADYQEIFEDHDSFFIGSDIFFSFLVNNDLFRLRWQLAREGDLSAEAFEDVERRFLEGEFSPEIIEQFRNMLDYYGQAPVIVRSSSLLEDSFGNAFAGKYRSEFCANQGSPRERLLEFLRAVKLVYASTLNPDALSYRRKHNLIDRDEQMAILVQRVAGSPYKQYFFPSLAGVAISRNLFVWTDRIDEKQGLVRMVFGLGTRAVNRVGSDYPRMFAVSHPQLRPELGRRILTYSQRQVDVIDLHGNRLTSVSAEELLSDLNYPQLKLYTSLWKGSYLLDTWLSGPSDPEEALVLTFNTLLERTDFVSTVRWMLKTLEEAYGHPVDTEFTASIDDGGRVRVNLVQCRPLFLPDATEVVEIADDIPQEQVLFRSSGTIRGGSISRIRYILYIDPAVYHPAPMTVKRSIPHLVGRINHFFEETGENVIMMGPGRWGSSSINLGIGVGYAQINHTQVLVEMAREAAGLVPDVSYGTHFFQDLVEDEIIYLAVYPDDQASEFNESFFSQAPNALTQLLPDAGEFADVVRLIDLVTATGGFAKVVADPQAQIGICYLEPSA